MTTPVSIVFLKKKLNILMESLCVRRNVEEGEESVR